MTVFVPPEKVTVPAPRMLVAVSKENVPLLTLSVAPLSTRYVAATPVLPPDSVSVPLSTSAVPELLKGTPLVSVNAPVTSNVPELFTASVPPLSKISSPPAVKAPALSMMPLVSSRTSEVPVMVAVWPEGIVSVPPLRKTPSPVMFRPPLTVTLGTASVPPDQVNRPLDRMLPVPVNPSAVRFTVVTLRMLAPRLTVPLTVTAPLTRPAMELSNDTLPLATANVPLPRLVIVLPVAKVALAPENDVVPVMS